MGSCPGGEVRTKKEWPPRGRHSAFQHQLHKTAEGREKATGVDRRTNHVLQILRLEAIWTSSRAIGDGMNRLYDVLTCH